MFGLFNNKGKYKSIKDAYNNARSMEVEQYNHLVNIDKGIKGLEKNPYTNTIYSATKLYRDYGSGFNDVNGHAVEYRDGYTKSQLLEKVEVFNDLIDNANLVIGNYVELIKGDIPQMFSDIRNESQTRIKALELVISEFDVEPVEETTEEKNIFDWTKEDFLSKEMYNKETDQMTTDIEKEILFYQTQLIKIGEENPKQMNFVAEISDTFKASTGKGIDGMLMVQKAISAKMTSTDVNFYKGKKEFYSNYYNVLKNLYELTGEDNGSVFFYDHMAVALILGNIERMIQELS